MNRRQFVKAFVGAVATVAIGLNLATPEPKWIGIDWARDPDTGLVWRYEHKSVILNPAALVRIGTA